MLYGKDPDYSSLRIIEALQANVGSKGLGGKAFGCSHDSIALGVYNPRTRRVESRNVIFIKPLPYQMASMAELTTDNDSYMGNVFNVAGLLQPFGAERLTSS